MIEIDPGVPELSALVVAPDGPPIAVQELPFPLAECYRRLQRELRAKQAVAAIWQLKDAVEAGLKLAAILGIADLLRTEPDDQTLDPVLRILFKQGGLSVGDWSRLLGFVLGQGYPDPLLPRLRPAFFKDRGRPTPLMAKLGSGHDNFSAWRNRVFGHGVFQADPDYYTREIQAWTECLDGLYRVLHDVLSGWDLIDSRGVSWRGVGDPPPWDGHLHQALDPAEELALVRRVDGSRLALGPLLTIQVCGICQFPHAFFFDRDQLKNKCHNTHFLDYFRGHSITQIDVPDVIRLAGRLPQDFVWERATFDQNRLVEEDGLVFQSFEEEYLRPDYLHLAVDALLKQERGYLDLIGAEGSGKTWFVRGITDQLRREGVKVLPYHIRAGDRSDYRTFVTLIGDEAKMSFAERTQEIQTRVESVSALANQFVDFLGRLRLGSGGGVVLVILDGLDELPEPMPGQASVIDFLPQPEDLPDSCQILLTRRQGVRPYVAKALARLSRADLYHTLHVDPKGVENCALVRTYVSERLPPQWVEAALSASQGVFLYAFHLVRAIGQGAFVAGEALPTGRDFYPAYLEKIRGRVGAQLFEDCYLAALLLILAARQPVSLRQLVAWGQREEQLRFALLDLRDFLREHRDLSWQDSLATVAQEYRYQIAHDSFVRYVDGDDDLRVRLAETHKRILEITESRYATRWKGLDLTDDLDLYALRYAVKHAELGLADRARAAGYWCTDYAFVCIDAASDKEIGKRGRLALDLCDAAVAVLSDECHAAEAEALFHLARGLMVRAKRENQLFNDHEAALMDALRGIQVTDALLALDPAGPKVVRDLRVALYVREGHACRLLGQLEAATGAFEAAVADARLGSGCREARKDEAKALNGLAIVAAWSKHREEAIRQYDRALALHRLGDAEGDPEAKGRIATVLRNKAMSLRGGNRLGEAEAVTNEAIGIGECLAKAGRGNGDLASGLNSKGHLLVRRGTFSAALHLFHRAAALRKEDIDSGRSGSWGQYYANRHEEAVCLRELGQYAVALPIATEVLDWRRNHHKSEKPIPYAVASALYELARIRKDEGHPGAALPIIQESVEWLEGFVVTGRPLSWETLFRSLALRGAIRGNLGDLAGAIQDLDRAVAMFAGDYALGSRSMAVDYGLALLWRASLLTTQNRGRSQDDLLAAREVFAERWKGGSFCAAPGYLEANRVYAGLVCDEGDWSSLAGALRGHLECLDTIADKLPGGDPEPLDRCASESIAFRDFVAGIGAKERDCLSLALGEEAPGIMAAIARGECRLPDGRELGPNGNE